jgi:hypothetical protein
MFDGMGDWYPEHQGEWVEGEEFDRRSEIVSLIVECRESITEDSPSLESLDEFVERNRNKAEDWLDSHYTWQQLGAVREMVRRTFQFSKLDAFTIPSEQTALYISEASRSYIHGFLLSSVAMGRCALEQALKEGLTRSNAKPDGDPGLLGLIEHAERRKAVLSPDSLNMARELGRKCNKVMHSRPVRSEEAVLNILDGIRGLLKEIYTPAAREDE